MGVFSASRYCILSLYFVTLVSTPTSSFSFTRFSENGFNFDSEISLFGDADLRTNDSSVAITRPSVASFGMVMCKDPIRISGTNPKRVVSFSTYFSFSISPGNNDGLAFLIIQKGFPAKSLGGPSLGISPGVIAVEFDTSMDAENRDPNGNHIGIDIGSLVSIRVRDVSEINLVLNSGEKMQSWIDYDLNSRKLEVRLSKSGVGKPLDPLISYYIDLSAKLEDGILLGLSSSSRNATRATSVYSWCFKLKHVSSMLHSEPLDPQDFEEHIEHRVVHSKSDYVFRILSGVILGAGCGAMLAVIAMFVWSFFADKPQMTPPNYPVSPAGKGYEKVILIGEKGSLDAKKYREEMVC